uniref:Cytochrome P450 n=1 Tax=Timema poppense TaxID=170557 RepID=A0A7R9CXC5_TIMPO|nr:unnamed protein product [Timema poppensis]
MICKSMCLAAVTSDSQHLETLRKYPVVHTLMRVCTRPYTLPGTNLCLEAGTKMVVPLFGLHYDPRYHPDPYRFDPERFSGEGSRPAIPTYTYLPFGEGPRNCIEVSCELSVGTKEAMGLLYTW